jgi:DNA processing protein
MNPMKYEVRNWSRRMWPQTLLEIPQPPNRLRIRGNFGRKNDRKRICVVGSRKYSKYGEMVCHKLISGLKGYNISIVSGLAFGIDSIAHSVALENGLHTIAIPGSGIDDSSIYPKKHLDLAKNILDSKGCLISEFADSFKATNWSFPQRNRLLVGISDVTLIIQGKEKSGTMITARMSIDYNHDLLTVPSSIFHTHSEGSNRLIKEGAYVIRNSEDILDHLGLNT